MKTSCTTWRFDRDGYKAMTGIEPDPRPAFWDASKRRAFAKAEYTQSKRFHGFLYFSTVCSWSSFLAGLLHRPYGPGAAPHM